MSELVRRSFDLLCRMFDPEQALFSHAAHLTATGAIRNDFGPATRLRYSINSFAGLQRAIAHGQVEWPLATYLQQFLERQMSAVTSPADRGLLLYVLSGAGHEARHELFAELARRTADRHGIESLHLQDVSWILMGLTRYAERDRSDASVAAAERVFRAIDRAFLNRDTMIPRYSLAGWRRKFSSFGGVAYFLKAVADYADAFGDRYAGVVFAESVSQIIALQGGYGEWPWFIDNVRARVADRYPVYSVHQDSMAMLFLLPAVDRGVAGAEAAVVRSYRWLFGHNELGEPMIVDQPFWIYRSIRRDESLERVRRFVRGVASTVSGRKDTAATPSSLAILRECRSYQLGWILYAWSPRRDFAEFTGLRLIARPVASSG